MIMVIRVEGMQKLRNDQTGFTLLELVVVVVSVLILAGLAILFR